jgi:flagellar biosynthesis protein FliP
MLIRALDILRCARRAPALAIAVAMLLTLCTTGRAQMVEGPFPTDAVNTRSSMPATAIPMAGSDPSAYNPLEALAAVGSAMRTNRSASGDMSAGDINVGDGLSVPIKIIAVLTFITLVPSIILMTTCFVRILIVIGLLKQAIGTQTLPPPQVVLGLSLFMTLIVMSPTIDRINTEAVQPYRNGLITDYDTLWEKSRQPIRDFMFAQIDAQGNWSSVYSVLSYRGVDVSDPSKLTRADVDMVSLIPAFMLSELKTAFLIGFRVFLPFLVIDIVISTILISMGMMMLPPVLISLPFKLLLFVLVDGWNLIATSLLASFAPSPATSVEQALLDGVSLDVLQCFLVITS